MEKAKQLASFISKTSHLKRKKEKNRKSSSNSSGDEEIQKSACSGGVIEGCNTFLPEPDFSSFSGDYSDRTPYGSLDDLNNCPRPNSEDAELKSNDGGRRSPFVSEFLREMNSFCQPRPRPFAKEITVLDEMKQLNQNIQSPKNCNIEVSKEKRFEEMAALLDRLNEKSR